MSEAKILNPNHEVVKALGTSEYAKLLVTLMRKLGMQSVSITAEDISAVPEGTTIAITCNKNDITLSLHTIEEGMAMAKKEGGKAH